MSEEGAPQDVARVISAQLREFQKIWADLSDGEAGVRLCGPELAVRHLAEAIMLPRLPNKKARGLLRKELTPHLLKRLAGAESLAATLDLISRELEKKSEVPTDQLKSSLGAIRKHRRLRTYFRGLVTAISIAVLETTSSPDWQLIRWLTHMVRVSYRLDGFDDKELIDNIFFPRDWEDGGLLRTTYPAELLQTSRLTDSERQDTELVAAHNALLRDELSALTETERFDALVRYRERPPKARIYLFAVRGIKGTKAVRVGAVQFYSPAHDPMITGSSVEAFAGSDDSAMNAAIAVVGQGGEEDRAVAVRIVQMAIDMLSFYLPTRVPIEIATQQILVVEAGDTVTRVVRNYRPNVPFDARHFHARDLDELTGQYPVLELTSDTGHRLVQEHRRAPGNHQIDTALRAKSKGDDTAVLEDRLLNYWICIESLIATGGEQGLQGKTQPIEDAALRAIPALFVNSECTDVGWRLYFQVRRALENNRLAGVSQELVERSQIIVKPSADPSLPSFLETLADWMSLAKDSLLRSQIQSTKRFYEDRETARADLTRMRGEAHDDLIFIYQFRNRIVHNAYFHSQGTAYFVARAQRFASLLMEAILADPELERSRVIGQQIASADRILKSLEHDENFKMLDEVRNRQDRPGRSRVFRELAMPAPGGTRLVRPGGKARGKAGFRFRPEAFRRPL